MFSAKPTTPPVLNALHGVMKNGCYHLIIGCPVSPYADLDPHRDPEKMVHYHSNHRDVISRDRIERVGRKDEYDEARSVLWCGFGDQIFGNKLVIASIAHRDDPNGELLVAFEALSQNGSCRRLVAFTCCLAKNELARISDALRNDARHVSTALAIFEPRFPRDLMLPPNPNIISAGGMIYLKASEDGKPPRAHYDRFPEQRSL